MGPLIYILATACKEKSQFLILFSLNQRLNLYVKSFLLASCSSIKIYGHTTVADHLCCVPFIHLFAHKTPLKHAC